MSQPLPPEPEDTRPQGGFGAPIRKPAEAKPEWRKREGAPGIWESADGKMKTEIPPPKNAIEEAMDAWYKAFNAEHEQDYLP